MSARGVVVNSFVREHAVTGNDCTIMSGYRLYLYDKEWLPVMIARGVMVNSFVRERVLTSNVALEKDR